MGLLNKAVQDSSPQETSGKDVPEHEVKKKNQL